MTPGEFIVRCFNARTAAHILHLKSRSYAQHVALQEFYDGLIPLVDKFAEAYQGDYGLIDSYPALQLRIPADGLNLLDDLDGWMEQNMDKIIDEDETCLKNIIDEIGALIKQTAYKLRFLK